MPISEFWYWTDKGVCKIKNFKYKLFLEQNGFYKYYPEGSENFVFVRFVLCHNPFTLSFRFIILFGKLLSFNSFLITLKICE